METNVKMYEGMFLLDAGNPDFQAASEPVKSILARSGAEVLALKPWDERKLAFEIQKRKRCLYMLAYFKVDPLKVGEIEHDCQLDERIVRVLILKRDSITQEQLDAPTPMTGNIRKPEGEEAAPVGEAAVPGSGEPVRAAELDIPEEIPPDLAIEGDDKV